MKTKILLTSLLMSFTVACWGQGINSNNITLKRRSTLLDSQTVANIFTSKINGELNSYLKETDSTVNKAVNSKLLQKNLTSIYQSIIPNNQALNDNTSSFAYTQSEDKQKLSISTAYQFKQYSKYFMNIGISTEGKSGIFNLYSSKSWSNNTSLNLGFSGVIWSSQYYESKEVANKLQIKRILFADSLNLSYQLKLKQSLKKLQSDSSRFQDSIKKIANSIAKMTSPPADSITKNLEKYHKKASEVYNKIEEYKSLITTASMGKADAEISNKFVAYDEKNNILYGYNVLWFQISNKFLNNTYNFAQINNKEIIASKNVFHNQHNFAVMFNHEGPKTTQYITGSFSPFRGSFLSNPALTGVIPKLDSLNNTIVQDGGTVLGSFADIKKPVWQFTYMLYYANFFLFEKSLGLTASASYNHSASYANNYTLQIGPIFRVQGESDWAKATFGISGGFENLQSKVSKKDNFAIKAYVGVPFTVFKKKADK